MSDLRLIFLSNLVIQAACAKYSSSITTLSACACEYNGHLYNLSSLAMKDDARFQESIKGYTYGYNPCVPFTMGLTQECKNVAMCYWSNEGQSYEGIGFQNDVYCDVKEGIVELVFRESGTRLGMISTIQLKCNNSKAHKATMKIKTDAAEPILEVEHKCCCPDGCLAQPVLPTTNWAPIHPGIQTPPNPTNVWKYTVGAVAGVVLLSILVALLLNKAGIPCRDNNPPRVLENVIFGEDEERRSGVEHDDNEHPNRPDYGAVKNTYQNIIPPAYHEDSGSEGGREGVEHEEDRMPNELSESLDFAFGVPEDGFTNPTQTCEEEPKGCCSSEERNCHKV